MRLSMKTILAVPVIVTLLALGLWVGTGRDAYTKFEVVEEIQKPVDPSDPFAGSGLYDSNTKKEVVRRPEFRFGLFPTPSGIFDKHIVSVMTVAGPVWGVAIVLLLLRRRSRRATGHIRADQVSRSPGNGLRINRQ